MDDTYTIWVCKCCMLNHANGECGCGAYYGEDPDHDPLSLVDNSKIAMGDGEVDDHSYAPCQGCGSWIHGERHAFTVWR